MAFIKPLDKDIYNLYEKVNIAKNTVFGLLQEEYDGKISNIVDNLKGQSAEERARTFDLILERLPSIEYIENLCRRAMDEATGKRQKLEYPLGQFLREKYPEMTVRDIQNSPNEALVHSDWSAELCKRYPEIEEAYKELPKVQGPALETLTVLLKLRFLRDQELAKIETSTKKDALPQTQNENNEKIFNVTETIQDNRQYSAPISKEAEKILNKAKESGRVNFSSIEAIKRGDGKIDVKNSADAFVLEKLLCFPSTVKKGCNERMSEYFTIKGENTEAKNWKSPRLRNKNPDTKAFLHEIGFTE